jgi:hypothetical protein
MFMTGGTVFSSRERVNVILPGTGEGNHFWPPVRGNAVEYIRKAIVKTLEEEKDTLKWLSNGKETRVSVYVKPERGVYNYSVWQD